MAETTFGSVVEIILFMVLIQRGDRAVPIIRAAILGSILANMLLCLGLCFLAGGLRREEQEFHEAVSEVGSNLMLVAGSESHNPILHPNPGRHHTLTQRSRLNRSEHLLCGTQHYLR